MGFERRKMRKKGGIIKECRFYLWNEEEEEEDMV